MSRQSTKAKQLFKEIADKYKVKLPEDTKRHEVFSYFETRNNYSEKFWNVVKKTFDKRKYRKSGIYDYVKTRQYHSVWDKHYDEVITLRFSDFTITLTRVYTYQNTYGRKYHEYDYIEIQPNEAN